MYVENKVDAVFLGPPDIPVQPLPSGLLVLIRPPVIFKKTVIEVKADGVHLHFPYPQKIPFVMVLAGRKRRIPPNLIAKADSFQSDWGVFLPHHKLPAFGTNIGFWNMTAAVACLRWGRNHRGCSAGRVARNAVSSCTGEKRQAEKEKKSYEGDEQMLSFHYSPPVHSKCAGHTQAFTRC